MTTNAMLDGAGIERIEQFHAARFDLTDQKLYKAEVGLATEDFGPAVEPDDGENIQLIVAAPDGELRIDTPSLRFFDDGGSDYIERITAYSVGTDEEIMALIRAAPAAYGTPQADVDRYVSEHEAALRGDDPSHDIVLGTGFDLGIGVGIEVDWDPSEPRKVLTYTIHGDPNEYGELDADTGS